MHKSFKPPAAGHRTDSKRLDQTAVLAYAVHLRRTALVGGQQALLKGQNLGLLCDDGRSQAIAAFRDAAIELGARVGVIASDLTSDSQVQKIDETARLLSRLYDAVQCDGLADEVVARLARGATIPVMSGHIAAAEQADQLARQLEGADTHEHKRRSVLQALVMLSVG